MPEAVSVLFTKNIIKIKNNHRKRSIVVAAFRLLSTEITSARYLRQRAEGTPKPRQHRLDRPIQISDDFLYLE